MLPPLPGGSPAAAASNPKAAGSAAGSSAKGSTQKGSSAKGSAAELGLRGERPKLPPVCGKSLGEVLEKRVPQRVLNRADANQGSELATEAPPAHAWVLRRVSHSDPWFGSLVWIPGLDPSLGSSLGSWFGSWFGSLVRLHPHGRSMRIRLNPAAQ